MAARGRGCGSGDVDGEDVVKHTVDPSPEEIQAAADAICNSISRMQGEIASAAQALDRVRELSRIDLSALSANLNQLAKANARAREAMMAMESQLDAAARSLDPLREAASKISAQAEFMDKAVANLRQISFLRGVGSLVDLFPDPHRYEQILPRATAEERMGEVWSRVGNHIRQAAEVVSEEQRREAGD